MIVDIEVTFIMVCKVSISDWEQNQSAPGNRLWGFCAEAVRTHSSH